jgi:hypothetical protein
MSQRKTRTKPNEVMRDLVLRIVPDMKFLRQLCDVTQELSKTAEGDPFISNVTTLLELGIYINRELRPIRSD